MRTPRSALTVVFVVVEVVVVVVNGGGLVGELERRSHENCGLRQFTAA